MKPILILLTLLVVPLVFAGSINITLTEEDFNRADGSLGYATNGNAWYNLAGTIIPYINSSQGFWKDNGTNPSGYLTFSQELEVNDTFCVDAKATQSNRVGPNIILYDDTVPTHRVEFKNDGYVKVSTGASVASLLFYSSLTYYEICIRPTNSSYAEYYVDGDYKGYYKNYQSNIGTADRLWFENSNVYAWFDNITLEYNCTENITPTLYSNTTIRECANYDQDHLTNPLYWYVLQNLTYYYEDENECGLTEPYYNWTAFYYFCDVCTSNITSNITGPYNDTNCLSNFSQRIEYYNYTYDVNDCKYLPDYFENYTWEGPLFNFYNATNTSYYEWVYCDYVEPAEPTISSTGLTLVALFFIEILFLLFFAMMYERVQSDEIFIAVVAIAVMVSIAFFVITDISAVNMLVLFINAAAIIYLAYARYYKVG